MPDYQRRSDGTWTISTTVLSWCVIGLTVMVVLVFLSGMYVGYNSGLQAGLQQAEESPSPPEQVAAVSKPPSDTAGPSQSSGDRESKRTEDESPRVITDRDLGQTSSPTTPIRARGQSDTAPRTTAPTGVPGRGPGGSDQEADRSRTSVSSGSPASEPSEPYYTVQVASSQKRSNAKRTRDRYRERGHEAMMTEAVVNGERYFRIRVGQFPTREAASRYAENMVESGDVDDYWISRVTP